MEMYGNGNTYNDYKTHILYFEYPLVENQHTYITTIYDNSFDIYYGENEFMRFYRYEYR